MILSFDEWLSLQTSEDIAWLLNEYKTINNAYSAYVSKMENKG